MQVKASLKNLRRSPSKVKLVIDLIRGLNVELAQNQLKFLNKGSAKDVLKLLNSAIANGENNFGLQKNNFFIKEIKAESGRTIKRWRPRAFGRAAAIRKRSCHIKLVLDEIAPTPLEKIKKFAPTSVKVIKANADAIKDKHDTKEVRKEMLSDAKIDGKSKGFAKKIFQRKAG